MHKSSPPSFSPLRFLPFFYPFFTSESELGQVAGGEQRPSNSKFCKVNVGREDELFATCQRLTFIIPMQGSVDPIFTTQEAENQSS